MVLPLFWSRCPFDPRHTQAHTHPCTLVRTHTHTCALIPILIACNLRTHSRRVLHEDLALYRGQEKHLLLKTFVPFFLMMLGYRLITVMKSSGNINACLMLNIVLRGALILENSQRFLKWANNSCTGGWQPLGMLRCVIELCGLRVLQISACFICPSWEFAHFQRKRFMTN